MMTKGKKRISYQIFHFSSNVITNIRLSRKSKKKSDMYMGAIYFNLVEKPMKRATKSRPPQRIGPITRDMEASNLPCSSAMRVYGIQRSPRELVENCAQNGLIQKEWLPMGLLVNLQTSSPHLSYLHRTNCISGLTSPFVNFLCPVIHGFCYMFSESIARLVSYMMLFGRFNMP